jgi:putative oxidoreductase
MFAAMVVVINIVMHDFWNVYEGLSQAHETQNFVKNLAIMAGLLVLSSNDGALANSVDQQLAQNRD